MDAAWGVALPGVSAGAWVEVYPVYPARALELLIRLALRLLAGSG
jgi:hypothetical protein